MAKDEQPQAYMGELTASEKVSLERNNSATRSRITSLFSCMNGIAFESLSVEEIVDGDHGDGVELRRA